MSKFPFLTRLLHLRRNASQNECNRYCFCTNRITRVAEWEREKSSEEEHKFSCGKAVVKLAPALLDSHLILAVNEVFVFVSRD